MRNINIRKDMVTQMIAESYHGWKNDPSQTLPFVNGDIEESESRVQQIIPYQAGSAPAVTIRFVELLSADLSRWTRLTPITDEELRRMGGSNLAQIGGLGPTNIGIPVYYMPQGEDIILIPTPNYTLADAVRVWTDLIIPDLDIDEPTAQPQFAKQFHRILSVGAALDYAITHSMTDKVTYLTALWNDYEKRLRDFYSKRYQDREPKSFGSGTDLVEEYS